MANIGDIRNTAGGHQVYTFDVQTSQPRWISVGGLDVARLLQKSLTDPSQELGARGLANALYNQYSISGAMGALNQEYKNDPRWKQSTPEQQKRVLQLTTAIGRGLNRGHEFFQGKPTENVLLPEGPFPGESSSTAATGTSIGNQAPASQRVWIVRDGQRFQVPATEATRDDDSPTGFRQASAREIAQNQTVVPEAVAQEAPFGFNPRTGAPITDITEAYSFARQENPGLGIDEFKVSLGLNPVTGRVEEGTPLSNSQATATQTTGGAPVGDASVIANQDIIAQLQNMEATTADSIEALAESLVDLLGPGRQPITLTEAELRQISQQVEDEFGPQFQRLSQRAQEDFDTSRRFASENLGEILSEAEKDLATGRQRIDENTMETLRRTQNQLAASGLSRSGVRGKQEGLIDRGRQRALQDLETQTQRLTGGQVREFERRFGSEQVPDIPGGVAGVGVSPSGIETGTDVRGLARRQEDISNERQRTFDIEQARAEAIRTLPI